MLRYQIAIGTNSGVYDYASTNIDYPRGQANIGNVTMVTGRPYYQTKITNIAPVYWKVFAIDSAFKKSAYISEQMNVLLPQWISCTSVSTHEIDLKWNDFNLPNETSYTLFRNTVNSTNGSIKIAGLSANVTNFSDINLQADTTYYYWLKAYYVSGASPYSAVRSATTLSTPPDDTSDTLKNNTFSVKPNPLLKSKAIPMTIKYKAETGIVKFEVYSMIGRLVTTIVPKTATTAHWDGKNSGGREVASGIYLMIMRVDGKMVYGPIKVGYIKK